MDFWRSKLCEISVQICHLKNWTPVTFKWHFSVLFFLCFRARLIIDALWSPAWKGLTSWLSFVMSNYEGVTFQLLALVSCGLHFIDSWSLLSLLLSCVSSGQHPYTFYFMHYPVFEQLDTLSFVLLDCIILHIYGKQFRYSVFTFVQYITNTGITDLNDFELFSQPLHIINKLGQFMSILSTVILPRWKNQKYAKIPSNYRKTQQKH